MLPSRVRMELSSILTYQCRMCSRKLLTVGREDAGNMWIFITEYIWIISAAVWLFKEIDLIFFVRGLEL